MSVTSAHIHYTPLYQEHLALNAKMVEFGGWMMPLQYEGIIAEWPHNRQTCSIFDCSHMGEFLLEADFAQSGFDRIVTQKIDDMPVGSCRYGMMCNDQGGIIDDLIVYRLGQEKWMIVVNAANIDKDFQHLKMHLTANAQLTNISFQTAKLDVQGPLSRDVLLSLVPSVKSMSYYTFEEVMIRGIKCLVSRTGYTGELGYEIYCPWENAKNIWQDVLKFDKVKPTGLGVRDVLRIEVCYPLYGHELNTQINPLEAGLKRFVDLNKDFIGKDAIIHTTQRRKAIAIKSLSRKSPREGNGLFNQQGAAIGVVSSGTYSPGLAVGIGLGFVDHAFSVGDEIFFGDDKQRAPAVVSQKPLYTKGTFKN